MSTGAANGFGVYGDTNIGSNGVFSNGDLGSSGFKTFRIDRPLDPLTGSSCNTPRRPGADQPVLGQRDPRRRRRRRGPPPGLLPGDHHRCALRPDRVGSAALGLHIAQEVAGSTFRVAGGPAGLKVSWTVTATRNDAYARAVPASDEVLKQGREVGRYLRPELHGQPAERSIVPRPQPLTLDTERPAVSTSESANQSDR